jgi:hypothetical protein
MEEVLSSNFVVEKRNRQDLPRRDTPVQGLRIIVRLSWRRVESNATQTSQFACDDHASTTICPATREGIEVMHKYGLCLEHGHGAEHDLDFAARCFKLAVSNSQGIAA